jgi:hypothetical protein
MRWPLLLLSVPACLLAQTGEWSSLFDGKTLNGWIWSVAADPAAPCWAVENGLLRTTPGQGSPTYLLTRRSFQDFEFAFEWKAAPGANSGVKYRFQGYWVNRQLRTEPEGPDRIEPVALEYQIIDDATHPDALTGPTHTTAAVYEYWPARKDDSVKAEVWHTSRIIARGLHIEHWLDGHKVVSLELDDPEVQASFQRSKRRGSSPVLAKHERRSSPIALQFHDGIIWFRNLRIRPL